MKLKINFSDLLAIWMGGMFLLVALWEGAHRMLELLGMHWRELI